jgi:ribosome-binding factor A
VKSYKRTERVADLVMRELAIIIQRTKDDPLFAGVTITHVRLVPDFSHAKVFVTVFDQQKIKDTLAALNKAAGFLQHILSQKVNLRTTPKLYFVYDESIIRGQKLSDLIDEL